MAEEGTQIASLKWMLKWNRIRIYDTLDMIKNRCQTLINPILVDSF